MTHQILLTRSQGVPSSSPLTPSATTTLRSHAPIIMRDEVRHAQVYQQPNQIIEKQKRAVHSLDSLQTTKRAKIELDNGLYFFLKLTFL
jgi:hypothetical protein